MKTEDIKFETADGETLVGRIRLVENSAWAAVVAHPHPQYGGSMDNNVVYSLVDYLSGKGVTTLMFNFRGVGGSSGSHGDGLDETIDVDAAAQTVLDRSDAERLILAGYSFGAHVVARSSFEPVDRILLAAPPSLFMPFTEPVRPAGSLLVVRPKIDQFSNIKTARALAESFNGISNFVELGGGDHFMIGYESDMNETIEKFWGEDLGRGQE